MNASASVPWMEAAAKFHEAERERERELSAIEARDCELFLLSNMQIAAKATNKGRRLAAYRAIKKLQAEKSQHLVDIAVHEMLARYYATTAYSTDFPEEAHLDRLE